MFWMPFRGMDHSLRKLVWKIQPVDFVKGDPVDDALTEWIEDAVTTEYGTSYE